MGRGLLCMGVALAFVAPLAAQDRQTRVQDRQTRVQDRQTRRDIRHGEIVRVNPESNSIVVRSGIGRDAKEYEYHVGNTTRYWGPDRKVLNDGLRYNGWRAGTTVWYVPGEAQTVSELWLTDPNQQIADRADVYHEGKIVRVDPVTNLVVVRTRVGPEEKEIEYRVDPNTRYWGTDQQPFTTALNYQGFREGNNIWFRTGPKERTRIMSDVRFYNPSARRPVRP
jgi:hypothetical protein